MLQKLQLEPSLSEQFFKEQLGQGPERGRCRGPGPQEDSVITLDNGMIMRLGSKNELQVSLTLTH